MRTLLLRLEGPLQSWGTDRVIVDNRGTELMPTKSGVIGLIGAALGRKRADDFSDLAACRYGVREDQHGKIITDFQTAATMTDANKKNSGTFVIDQNRKDLSYVVATSLYFDADRFQNAFNNVTHRRYLSDASFVAGLEGDDELIQKAVLAIRHPSFPLCLGRRSCVPSKPILIDVSDENLEDALEHAEISDGLKNALRRADRYAKTDERPKKTLRIWYEPKDLSKARGMIHDAPISFRQEKRLYGWRWYCERRIAIETEVNNDIHDKDHT